MDVERVELVAWDPADAGGFAAGSEFAADGVGPEAQGELLADFAVGVFDDVVGVGVDAYQARHLNLDAGFFAGFADDGVGDGFADVLGAAGDGPEVVVAALDHE